MPRPQLPNPPSLLGSKSDSLSADIKDHKLALQEHVAKDCKRQVALSLNATVAIVDRANGADFDIINVATRDSMALSANRERKGWQLILAGKDMALGIGCQLSNHWSTTTSCN